MKLKEVVEIAWILCINSVNLEWRFICEMKMVCCLIWVLLMRARNRPFYVRIFFFLLTCHPLSTGDNQVSGKIPPNRRSPRPQGRHDPTWCVVTGVRLEGKAA